MARREREEQELLDSFEQGEWQSVPDLEGQKRQYTAGARATLRKPTSRPRERAPTASGKRRGDVA